MTDSYGFDVPDDDIDEFLRNLRNEPVPEQDQVPPRAPPPEPTPEAPPRNASRTIAVINYEDRHFEEKVDDVVPETIRNCFGISRNVNFELIRRNVVYKVVGSRFEPELVPGTFKVRIVQQPQRFAGGRQVSEEGRLVFIHCNDKMEKAAVNDQGHVTRIPFRNANRWGSKFLVDDKGKVTEFTDDGFEAFSEHYYLLYYDQTAPQMAEPDIQLLAKPRQTSLEGMTLTNAAVFWVLFVRGFACLSKTNNDLVLDLEKEDLKDCKALICAKSCKANLFQIASSINYLMAKHVDYISNYHEMSGKPVQWVHDFLKQIEKIDAETTEFIHVLATHLKNTEPNEATVKVIMELDDLKRLDSDNRLEGCRAEALEYDEDADNPLEINDQIIDKVARTSTAFVWPRSRHTDAHLHIAVFLQSFTKNRSYLKEITALIDEMAVDPNLDVTKLLSLLKFFKQLISSTKRSWISLLMFWTVVGRLRNSQSLSDLVRPPNRQQGRFEPIFLDFEKMLSVWRAVGSALPLAVNMNRVTDCSRDWDDMKTQIFDAQYRAEIAFHQAVISAENPDTKPGVLFPYEH
uniref:Uncharacterized protein n=1 Tax=Panagrolaimus sp. JU765 TaxID=591449 RepID=A0AC34QMH3_9BILA